MKDREKNKKVLMKGWFKNMSSFGKSEIIRKFLDKKITKIRRCKMRAATLLLIVLSVGFVYAQTFMSGDVRGVWNVENSPYIVDDMVRIPAGDTLIIQPGVTVLFGRDAGMIVDSSAFLRAIGNAADSIYFLPSDTDSGWMGIKFYHSSGYSSLSYCTISGVRPQANGSELNDGGAIILDNSDVNIMHTTISDCSTGQYGGAISCIHSNPNIYYCVIENNYARFGGGGISLRDNSNATIFNNTIASNSVAFGVGKGAGIASFNSSPNISGNTIENNEAPTSDGGGLYIENADSSTEIENNNIENNFANYGAGIYVINSTCNIERNHLGNNAAAGDGGGIYSSNSNLQITGNRIEQNLTQEGDGAGIYIADDGDGEVVISDNRIVGNSSLGDGGAVFADNVNISLFENSITGNYSQSRGGAILIKSSRAEVSQNNLSDNHSKTGGAIYVDNSAVKILRNIISRNTSYDEFPSGRGGAIVCNRTDNAEISGNIVASNSSSTDGGGIYALDCEHMILTNNTISDNRAADNGGGIYLDNSSAAIVNSIIYGNTAETGGEMFTMECSVFFAYSDVFWENISSDNRSSFTYGDGTIDTDPGFSEIADTRYELAPFSTCIDAGVGSIYIESWDTTIDMLAYDVYGNERPQLANWDIGAVEYVGFGILSSVENHKPFSNEISVLTYPNPFNSKLEIKTSIPSGENIRISVYDMFGRKIGTIYDGTTTSDNQTFIWNAENEISGTYLLRVQHNCQVSDTKVRLIK